MRIPYACRHLKSVYMAVGKVVADDKYLDMTEGEFIGRCLQSSGGATNPVVYRQIYADLMRDAGLTALHSPMKSTEDNGDHSWEYYIAGETVKEEDIGAHSSYFVA